MPASVPTAPAPTGSPSASPHGRAACTAVIGLQWGDEGKGKVVDMLAVEHQAVVRFNGGANAGHSVVVKGERFALHLLPSGILYPGKLAVIGNGVVVDAEKLLEEIDGLTRRGIDTSGLVVSSRAHAVLACHKAEDGLREDLLKAAAAEGRAKTTEIGTTRRGIGPAYADKVQRSSAVRMGDLLKPEVLREKLSTSVAIKNAMLRGLAPHYPHESVDDVVARCLAAGDRLRPRIRDTTHLLHDLLAGGGRILFEGANGTLLDVDHGTYPYVTSSNTGSAGIGSGTGVPLTRVGRMIGIMKAYSTRVGAGPMPTELFDGTADRIRARGREFGTTTGRPRRVGWLDLVAVRYSALINGVTGLAVTLFDVLAGFDELLVCTAYDIGGDRSTRFPADADDLSRVKPVYERLPGFAPEIGTARKLSELPASARGYLDFVQRHVEVPIEMVGVGPDREQTIVI